MKIYPVIHMQSPEQALRSSKQAFDAGADGVFLIDHMTARYPDMLTSAYREVREALGEAAWIGVNYLALEPAEAVRHLDTSMRNRLIDVLPSALWCDDATTTADSYNVPERMRADGMEGVEYFGGIAFKYQQNYTDDPIQAAEQARQFLGSVDVVTTSGLGTRKPANAAKVQAMKQAIGDKPLALASGVSIHNIGQYRDAGLDKVLVASSIEMARDPGRFDPTKLRELIQKAHERD